MSEKDLDDLADVPEVNGVFGDCPDCTKPRPMVVNGATYRIDTPVGKAYITVNSDTNGEPFEVFVNVGKPGADVYAMAEALGRTISMSLRFNTFLTPMERVKRIVEELQGIGGSRTLGFGKNSVKSLPDAVAKVLATHFSLHGQQVVDGNGVAKNGTDYAEGDKSSSVTAVAAIAAIQQLEAQVAQAAVVAAPVPLAMGPDSQKRKVIYDLCPKCGEASLVHEEGCKKCYGCGYSAC